MSHITDSYITDTMARERETEMLLAAVTASRTAQARAARREQRRQAPHRFSGLRAVTSAAVRPLQHWAAAGQL